MSFPPFDFITPRIAIAAGPRVGVADRRITHVINARRPPDPIRGFVTSTTQPITTESPKGRVIGGRR